MVTIPAVSIVSTGGPHGGKSAFGPLGAQLAREFGWHAYVFEEPATSHFKTGVLDRFKSALAAGDLAKVVEYEMAFTKTSFAFQAQLKHYAKIEQHRSVGFFDRAVPDNWAYFPEDVADELHLKVLRRWGYRSAREVLARYDAVFKFTSTALGAVEHYTCADNICRDESIEEARRLDRRVGLAYWGHPYFYAFDNSTDFEGKIARALGVLRQTLSRFE